MDSILHQKLDKTYADDFFQLHYQIAGQGHCLVLVHGYMDNANFWSDFITRTNNQYQTIAIDLPGHGESQYLEQQVTLENMAASITDLLMHENIKSATFIGHSMGGYLAMAVAALFPQLVQSLILVNSHPFTDDAKRWKNRKREIEFIRMGKFDLLKKALLFNRFNASFFAENPSKLHLVETALESMTAKNAEQTLTILLSRSDYSKNLLTSTIPILFCLSPNDKQIDNLLLTNLYSSSKHIEFKWFTQSQHMSYWEEPEHFFVTVMGFIRHKES